MLHQSSASVIELKVDQRGNFSLLLEDEVLLLSSPHTSFQCANKTLSSAHGTLSMSGSSHQNGSDALGAFERHTNEWVSKEGLKFTTAVRIYHSQDAATVLFDAIYHQDCANSSSGSPRIPISSYPSFVLNNQSLLGANQMGFVEWDEGCGAPCSYGMFPRDYKPPGPLWEKLPNISIKGGSPMAFMHPNNSMAAVLSPIARGFIAHQQIITNNSASEKALVCGLSGAIESVPKDYSVQTVLAIANGVNSVFRLWGSAMMNAEDTSEKAWWKKVATATTEGEEGQSSIAKGEEETIGSQQPSQRDVQRDVQRDIQRDVQRGVQRDIKRDIKRRPDLKEHPNKIISHLGYSTTAFYFYDTLSARHSYEDTLLAVANYSRRVGLQYAWYQLDSWCVDHNIHRSVFYLSGQSPCLSLKPRLSSKPRRPFAVLLIAALLAA
jgi:hypothetical protein